MNEDGIPEDLAAAVEAAFVSVIAQARASAVAAIRARSSTLVAAAGTDHVAQPDAVFNIDEWMERVNAEVGPTIEKVLIDSANQAGIGVSLDLADPRMAAAAVRHIDGIASWGQNFRQTVAKVIEEGMAKGWSVDRMADKLAETGSLTDASARRIARTEAIAAANAGTIEGWKLLGFVSGKRWLATPDEKTRDTHAAADGQEVPLDGRFTIGDGTADYPGDPALPVGERVNCRCRMLSIDDGADTAPPEPQDTTVTMPAKSSIRLPQPPPGTIDDGTWRTTTDRVVHARSLWAESPTVRRTIIDVQANLVRGRAPDHVVDFVDVVTDLASDPAITIDSVSQRWWQQPETIRDHVVAAADELLGQLDDAPSVNRRLYAPVDPRWLAGALLVGATIAMLSPSEWTDTDDGDGVVAMDPPVDAVEVVPGSYLWAGAVQVTGIDRDRSRLSVRPLDRSRTLVATAAKADVYAEFANPNHDELGRFARQGGGRRVPAKGVDGRVDRVALDPRGATIAYEDLFPGNPIPPGETRPPQVLGPILKRPGYKGVFRDLNNRSRTSVGGEHQVYITEKGATRVSFLGTAVINGPQWNVFDHQKVIAEILDTSQAIDPSIKIQFGIVRGVDDWMHGGTDAAVAFDIPDRIVFPTPSKIKDKVQWAYLTKKGTPDHFMPAAKKSTWAEYVTTHEHGHAAHFRLLREDGQPIERHKSKLTIDVRELVRAELDRRGSPLLARAHLGLSEYGMSNEYEAVAEAFAQRHLDPAKLSVGAREILDRAGLGEETQP